MSSVPQCDGWATKPLIEVATLQRGYDLPVQERTDGQFPIFAANGPVGVHSTAKCKGPGVVTGRSGTIGRVHFVKEDYWPLNTSLYVTDFHGNDPRWVFYMLQDFGLERFSQGAGVPTLNRNLIHGEPVKVPPVDEQRRIAAILDKADVLRIKRREGLAQVESLAQSIFVEMFGDLLANPKGWPVVSLGEVADVQGGLQVTSARKNLPVEVPYLRVANVYRGRLQLNEVKNIRATANEVARTKLVPQDLLVVEGHGNPEEVGRVALWAGELEECVHQNHLIRVRFDLSTVAPAFMCEYLNSPRGRQHLLRAGKTTSGLNTISVSNVRAVPIFLPPFDAQKVFEQRLREVGRLKAVHQASFEATHALFTSLQASAFRGKT